MTKSVDAYLEEVQNRMEAKGFSVDMFKQPHINHNREFGKVGRAHAEIKFEHYLFEGFRGSDYVAVNVTVWSYYRVDRRYISTGELLKRAFEIKAIDEHKKLLEWT